MSGIYEFFKQFWMENAKKAFNLSEHGLFHLLLNEANRRHWQMPLVLHTSIITMMLKTTKQNVIRARIGVRNRGIISFRDGINRHAPSEYTLLAINTHDLSQQVSQELSQELSQGLSQEMSQELSQELSLHNSIDNKNKEERFTPITTRAKGTDLYRLKEIFSNDIDWLRHITSTLSCPMIRSPDDVLTYLNRFFDEQIAQGIKAREENDCRKHFFFWLKKIIQNNKTNVFKNKLPQQRRGTGVSTGTAADFEQPFNAADH